MHLLLCPAGPILLHLPFSFINALIMIVENNNDTSNIIWNAYLQQHGHEPHKEMSRLKLGTHESLGRITRLFAVAA